MDEQAVLEKLRSSILDEVIPLAEEADLEPSQKFTLLINAARLSGEAQKFEAAHQAALGIDAPKEKAEALLDLLEEIDIKLGEIDESAMVADQSTQNIEQPAN